MSEDKIEIVYCGDEKYLPYLIMSSSTVYHYNPNVHITYLSPTPVDVPEGIDNVVMNPPESINTARDGRRTIATYLRLMTPLLPYNKIIYLDPDVLCLKPLDELWNLECDYISLCEGYIFGEKQAMELGHDKYALAGMMLMNLDALREDKFIEKAFTKFDSSFMSCWSLDESIINYWFYDKIKFIDRKFNYCFRRRYRDPIPLAEVVLLHFPGRNKEWMQHIYKGICQAWSM